MQAARVLEVGAGDGLFVAIGAFLDAHGLSPDPDHYRLAHAALTDPAMAVEVARLTDGGVRLGRRAIEALGGTATTGRLPPAALPEGERRADALVAATRAQVDGFAALVDAMRAETSGFGRDLAASAAALSGAAREEVSRLAGAMLGRIADAETRLAHATAETQGLRVQLAAAQDEARRDPLTGLPNRLALDEAFAQAAAGPLCLAVCDVDHFKQLNDCHGHGVGDRVLIAIGQALARGCAGHLVARHGGEEFVVLLRGVALAEAAALLDATRAELAERRFRDRDTGESLGRVTFSAGAVTRRQDEPVERTLARADRLLYAAKEQGRDRVLSG